MIEMAFYLIVYFFFHGITTLSTALDGPMLGKTEVHCLQDP